MAGRFITFEGGEGAGKSTQINRLRRRLDAQGVRCLVTREPGGSPRAEAIRRHLLAGRAKRFGPLGEALLFNAARRDHLDTVIRPALQRGLTVLCDRFLDSTRAYQGAVGYLEPSVLDALDRVVVGETRPDRTIVLDVPVEVGIARAADRRAAQDEAVDRFEAEDRAFHERLRQAFLAIAAADPERCTVVDGSGAVDDVERAIWTALAPRSGPTPTSERVRGAKARVY